LVERLGLSLTSIRAATEKQMTHGSGNLGQEMQLTPRAKRAIDLAYEESRRLDNNYIGTDHLLLSLILEEEGLAGRVLRELGADLERARAAVDAMQAEAEAEKRDVVGLVDRVKAEFQQAVEQVAALSPEARALIHVLTLADPGQVADAVASYLKLEEADQQELLPTKPPHERLEKLSELLKQEPVKIEIPREAGPGGQD
jgi:ATP-dependent Clp protease ATP-binding subunit ClpA